MSILKISAVYTGIKYSLHITTASAELWTTALLFTFLFYSIGVTEEYVGSRITKDTRWSAEESPYIIERDLVIEKGASLTIAPGVTVIIKKPKIYEETQQYDNADSQFVSIKVKGALNCIGRPDRRITFITQNPQLNSYGWYGIIFDNAPENFAEIAYTDINNAFRGISVKQCNPVIRNLILEYNHIGIYCSKNGNAKIYNCVITENLVSGIHIREANPVIANNIIVNNKNQGVLCDGSSSIDFEYNCVYGNKDGNFLDCTPELGVIIPNRKDSTLKEDYAHNIYMDPVFSGSIAESIALEHDLSLPTVKSKVRDTSLANEYYSGTEIVQSSNFKRHNGRYQLSRYSPCNNRGSAEKELKNIDGSRNTMGIWGGPEYLAVKEKFEAKSQKAAKPKQGGKKEKSKH